MNKNITKDKILKAISDLSTCIEYDTDEYNINDQLTILKDVHEYVKSSITIDELREHYDVDPYLYYIILKEGYRKLFGLDKGETFLTQCKEDSEVFHDINRGETSKYKSTFTIDEINQIKQKYSADLEIYDIIKVADYKEIKNNENL